MTTPMSAPPWECSFGRPNVPSRRAEARQDAFPRRSVGTITNFTAYETIYEPGHIEFADPFVASGHIEDPALFVGRRDILKFIANRMQGTQATRSLSENTEEELTTPNSLASFNSCHSISPIAVRRTNNIIISVAYGIMKLIKPA
jgi:hypothetical protein